MKMKEEKVFWKNGFLTGEGLLQKNSGDAGVVICHPHPLMGGSMFNNVVETVRDVFHGAGYSTLRFHFRGVGESSGSYDEGRGEMQDVMSACEFLKSRGSTKVVLAGYSFGAWVCSQLLQKHPTIADSAVFISPPHQYFPFDWHGLENVVDFIICGDSDLFADARDLQMAAQRISAKWTVLPATDHFYSGREDLLAEHLNHYLHEKKA
jgi:uncharacterized protein